MIPYAKFFASRRVIRRPRRTPPGRSSHEDERRLAREPRARRPRPPREDVPAGRFERVERRQAATREERDRRPSRPPIRARSTSPAASSSVARCASNAEQRAQLRARPVERRLAERAPVLRRAGRSRPSSRSRGTSWRKFTSWSPVQTESLAATSSGSSSRRSTPSTSRPHGSAEWTQYCCSSSHVSYSADALIHPVRLDQPQERLARQVELADRRLDVPQHRPRRAARRRPRRPRPRARRAPRAGRPRTSRRPRRRTARSNRARGCAGAAARGKSTDPTGKFSPAARAATSESSTRPFCLNGRAAGNRPGRLARLDLQGGRRMPEHSCRPRRSRATPTRSSGRRSRVEQGRHARRRRASRSIASCSPPSPSPRTGGREVRRRRDEDPLVMRARLLLRQRRRARRALAVGSCAASARAAGPRGAIAYIAGEGEAGYLDGVSPERIATDFSGSRSRLAFVRRAQLNMERAGRSPAGRPNLLGEPGLSEPRDRPRRSGSSPKDLLNFCRLTDADGAGTSGWTKHLQTLDGAAARSSRSSA